MMDEDYNTTLTRAPASLHRNPFPGLRPFKPREEHLFFGRERQIDKMVGKLAHGRFLAVVGTSGSGKSSLVNCGLRPALHRGYLAAAGSDWRIATCRPGHDPAGALAQALAVPGVLFDKPAGSGMTTAELIDATLYMGSLGLVDIVEQARLPAGTNLLVVVDQFEELFRYRARSGDGSAAYGPGEGAQAFVRLLLEAASQTRLPIYVVLTMRSDYLGDCAQFNGLPEAINEGQYLVPRLTRDEIRAAITGPVAMADVQLNPLLLTRLLNDVGDNPDQLSILQHALNRSFAHWENEGCGKGELDLAHYEAIGTMAGALDMHAEKAFWELSDHPLAPDPALRDGLPLSARQVLARRLFRAITDKGTDARGIRRPTSLDKLCAITGATPAELEAVMAVFRKSSRSFLMPPESETLTPSSRIDISHESLMRVWKQLVVWSDQEAAASRQYRRLSESAAMFERHEVDPMPERELELALDWRRNTAPNAAWGQQYGGGFEATARYIDASHAVVIEQRVAAELERRWNSTWRVALLVGLGLTFVLGQRLVVGLIVGPLSRVLTGDWVEAMLAPFNGTVAGLVEVSAHLLVGLPVFAAYGVLESVGRRLHQHYDRAAVTAALTRVAEPQAPPLVASASAPAPAPAPSASPNVAAVAAVRSSTAAQPGAAGFMATHSPVVSAEAKLADASHLASWWRRLVARLIDWCALLLWSFVVTMVVAMSGELSNDTVGTTFFVLLVAGAWLYSAWRISGPRQATLGLRWLGLKVTGEDGQRLSFARASARHWAKTLSYLACFLGCLMIFFTRHRQALHDKICKTLVLQAGPQA